MLKLTSARKRSTKLPSGEIMQYIPLPELPYDKLKVDFAKATHLATIDKLDLKGAGGVLIRCNYVEDGLLAAAYIFKKLTIECELNVQGHFDDEDYDYEIRRACDIEKAAAEIVNAERTVTNKSDSNKTIGFHQRVI